MVGDSIELETVLEASQDETSYWYRVIPALSVLLLFGAVTKSIHTLSVSGILLEAALDLLLIGSLGITMLYIGLWLPDTPIRPEFYPRIVLWVFGGVAAMALVLGLRVLHPGVEVDFTFGTQAVLLSIGSIAGLGIGIRDAAALTHADALEKNARALELKNDDLKRAEQRLEEAVTELEASNERLEQFAYAASHDLQEPLRMVTSYLQLVEDRYGDELDEDGEEFIEIAVDGADRMRDMIDGLLEYSRVETQGDPFEPVDLDAVLDDVLADLQFRIEETDAELTREELPVVEGDERQLRQLLQNLLSNAIEYCGDDCPRIHVSAEREGETWAISVRDEGIGIDTDETERIFEIFQRLHSSEEHAGSGIGLALCKRIVERHGVRASEARSSSAGSRNESLGGDLRVDSEPGVGSTFTFTLSGAADGEPGYSRDSSVPIGRS